MPTRRRRVREEERHPALDDVADWVARYMAWSPKTRDWVDLADDTLDNIRMVVQRLPAYQKALSRYEREASEYPDVEER